MHISGEYLHLHPDKIDCSVRLVVRPQLKALHYTGGDNRYTRRAVPLKIAAFSAGDAPAAIRLKAFHNAAYPIPIFSTGKLLSTMQRSGPKSSMQGSIYGRQ